MIKLFAIDIDGVLVKDTFSPVIKSICNKYGKEYIRDVERNVFSKRRKEASEYLINYLNLDYTVDEYLKYYFKERDEYIEEHGGGLVDGAIDFIKLLKNLGYKMVCYGGLSQEYFCEQLGEYKSFFDQYVCTNDFRPGIKEIVKDIYNYEYNEVVFIDDVNTVAETAKEFNVPFIGTPAPFDFSFQKKDMKYTGVKYILDSVKNIDEDFIKNLEEDIANNRYWKN